MTTRPLCRLITLSLAAGALVGCSERTPPPAEPVVRPVRYTELVRQDADSITKSFAGLSRSSDTSKLSLRVGGTLVALDVAVGDKVKKGQVLGRVDASDLELQVQEAASGLAQARAQLKALELEFERVRALYENNATSRSQYDQTRGQVEQARAGLSAARSRSRLAKRQVDYAKLVAPAAGVVTQSFIQLNENVSPGQPILTIASGGDIELLVNVAGTFVARVTAGQAVEVVFKDLQGAKLAGTVREIGVTPRDRETTYPVTVALDEKDPRVRPGMAAEVVFSVPVDPEDKGLFVPSASVARDASGAFVFTVAPESEGAKIGTVSRENIVIDTTLGARGVRVLEGLGEAKYIVTAGVSRLNDGQTVRMLGPTE